MQDTLSSSTRSNDQRAKNAFNISIFTAVLFVLIILTTVISDYINRVSSIDFVTLGIVGLGVVTSIISAILSRRQKSDLGIFLILATLVTIVITRVFVQKGLGISSGIVHIILVSSIAIYTLPAKWIGRAVITSFVVAIFTIVVDQFTSGVPVSRNPEFANLLSVIIGSIYLVVLATQLPNLPLRTKLIAGFLFLTIIPLAILGWQTFSSSREILQQQVKAGLTEESLAVSGSFQTFIDTQFSIMNTEAKLPDIVEYLTLVQQSAINSEVKDHARKTLATLGQKNPAYIKSYTLITPGGVGVLDVDPSRVGMNYSSEEFYKQVIKENKAYISNVIFPAEPPQEPIIYFAVPVFSNTGETIGIMLATYNANILQSIINSSAEDQSTASEYTFIVDDTYFINIGHSSTPEMLFKSLLQMDASTLVILQTQGVMNSGSIDSLIVPQPELTEELKNMGVLAYFQVPTKEYSGETAVIAATRIPNTSWIVGVAQLNSGINVLTQNQTRTIVVSSVVISLLAAIVAVMVSNSFTNPILKLTRAAENIASGDFSHKADVRQKDEIGVLARTFNNMAGQIQGLIEGLEERVEQRTKELQQVNAQNEKRAQELQTVAEIARYISTEKDLAKILPLITRIVSEQFGFYHVGIFLVDDSKKFAILRAANSPGGQEMLKMNHRLEVGQTGIVGNVTATGIPRVALDTGADAVYFSNSYLPNTHSEMALPLTVRGTIIGALDVQSIQPNAFTETDITILGLLADQIAIAIDNARLLEEAKNALKESESVFREYLAEAWQKKTASSVIGYYQNIAGGRPITELEPEPLQDTEQKMQATIAIPIRVRDQIIGTMNVRASSEDKVWDKDEIGVVEAVAERIGLALDNARLFEETSSRASRERLVSDITTKIRETNDPQEMIRTAVEELQRVLGATRVEIVPQRIPPSPDR